MKTSSKQLNVNNGEVTIPAPNQQHVPLKDRCCEEKPAAEILTEVCRSSTRHPQVGWSSSGGGGGRATSCLSASQESLVVVQIQQMQAAPSRYVAMCTYVDLWRSSSRSPGGSFLHREPPEWPSGNQSRWLIEADRRDAEETDQGGDKLLLTGFYNHPAPPPPIPAFVPPSSLWQSPIICKLYNKPLPVYLFPPTPPPPPATGGDRIVTHQ